MKTASLLPIATLLAATLGLLGCGGAGGAPPLPTIQPPNASVPPATVDITRATCADMTTLADALYYLRRGATQLDDDHDGKPCEAKFSQ